MAIGDAERALLTTGDLHVEGQLAAASNTTLRCAIQGPDSQVLNCVYKPVRGERPLWDFPTGTLAKREVAMFELSRVLNLPFVPLTVWREDGPFGPGMCQVWIDEDPETVDVSVFEPGEVPADFVGVLWGQGMTGEEVVLAHRNDDQVRAIALLDVIANNADRKGGHILTDAESNRWAIDHGVTFHSEPKLRTVLWGWAGAGIPRDIDALVPDLELITTTLQPWLSPQECSAVLERVAALRESRVFPVPPNDHPAIPWPVF